MIVEKLYENNAELIIKKTVEILKKGGVVIYPTETCYGIGVDATNEFAVSKLLKYKQRPAGKAISVAVGTNEQIASLIFVNEVSKRVIDQFLPGPITLVGKSKKIVDLRLESEKGTLGIRVSSNRFFQKLCQTFGGPITSTSANVSGAKTPYSLQDIFDNTNERHIDLVDFVIDDGVLIKNPPSTVVDISTDELKIHRSGNVDPRWIFLDRFTSKSEADTIEYGKVFLKKFEKYHWTRNILLSGDLGSGKTHFVKGIGDFLGVKETIKSPTYNYYSEYTLSDGKKFIHLDAWRIESAREIELLGIHDWTGYDDLVAIEWPTVLTQIEPDIFAAKSYFYLLFTNTGGDTREIKVYISKP